MVVRPCAAAMLPLALAVACAPAPVVAPSTLLVGQKSLGLWRGGRLVAFRNQDRWHFDVARLLPDGRTVAVGVTPRNGAGSPSTVLRFDAGTLAEQALGAEADLVGAVAATTLGTDAGTPDATGPGGPMIASSGPDGLALRPRALPGAPAHRLQAGTWRIALSPDGSTAAAFAAPARAGLPWQGRAWDTRTGRAVTIPSLFIDDGSSRQGQDAEGSRELACLLPNGEGAVFTYIGPPADRFSEYQSAAGGAPKPIDLQDDYVDGCLAPPAR